MHMSGVRSCIGMRGGRRCSAALPEEEVGVGSSRDNFPRSSDVRTTGRLEESCGNLRSAREHPEEL